MREYKIKPFSTPNIQNCWMITEYTDGQVTAAWGFRTEADAEYFLEHNVPKLRNF